MGNISHPDKCTAGALPAPELPAAFQLQTLEGEPQHLVGSSLGGLPMRWADLFSGDPRNGVPFGVKSSNKDTPRWEAKPAHGRREGKIGLRDRIWPHNATSTGQ